MNFNYPVRDCSDSGCSIDNSGLNIPTTGCQVLNGNQTLALARSRFFQYDDPAAGGWIADGTGDLGRIERQNLIIDALIQKVESTYNPLSLRSFLDSVVHDITIDNKLGLGTIYSLATRYHAFSPSKLVTFTLPTTPGTNYGGDVELVQEPDAQLMLTQFLGATPNTPTTPPLDVNSDPITVPPPPAQPQPLVPPGRRQVRRRPRRLPFPPTIRLPADRPPSGADERRFTPTRARPSLGLTRPAKGCALDRTGNFTTPCRAASSPIVETSIGCGSAA